MMFPKAFILFIASASASAVISRDITPLTGCLGTIATKCKAFGDATNAWSGPLDIKGEINMLTTQTSLLTSITNCIPIANSITPMTDEDYGRFQGVATDTISTFISTLNIVKQKKGAYDSAAITSVVLGDVIGVHTASGKLMDQILAKIPETKQTAAQSQITYLDQAFNILELFLRG